MDATAQAELVRSGEVSPAGARRGRHRAHRGAESRAERGDPPALRGGARPTEPADGPFRGVPFAAQGPGLPHGGRPAPRGHALPEASIGWREEDDTWLARRFREAGFVFVGQDQHARAGDPARPPSRTAYGPTRNPWDTTRSTGGSSGGSAAAVASGMVPIAHANDGGGSIRIPASALRAGRASSPRAAASRMAPDFGDVMSGLVARARGVPLGARHGGGARVRSRTRRPASPTSRPAARARTPRRSAPTRAGCASGS